MSSPPESLHGLTKKELAVLARHLDKVLRTTAGQKPQTPDELHQYVKEQFGIDIPRVSVCEGHHAPFDFVSDMFFEIVIAALVMANRSGSKTFMSALLHLLNSKFKPGCESASVGAVEMQAVRCYQALQKLLVRDGKKMAADPEKINIPEDHPEIASSIMRETTWRSDSKVEVLPGTPAGVNGPHPQKVHFDEVELADPVVFSESRSMSASKDGIMAQDWITSTRKRAHGPMQKLLDEIAEAERLGLDPPFKLYQWCIFEALQNQPNCRSANPGCENPCGCDKVVKGKWDDGRPRTFEDVCQGRAARSQGWIPLSDAHKNFRGLSQDVWEAQHECIKPSTKGLVLPSLNRSRHCIRWWNPDPDNGPIFSTVDFGGSNPHAVLWVQVLRVDVDIWGYHQRSDEEPKIRIPAGSRVVFDEIYRAEIGNVELADMVIARERWWKEQVEGWRVTRRFADVQAKAARLDWHAKGLVTSNFATKDIKEHVKQLRELVRDDRLFIDVSRTQMTIEEFESWHFPDKHGRGIDDPEHPVRDFDHTVAAFRYFESNVRIMERKGGLTGTPSASRDQYGDPNRQSSTGAGPARYLPVGRERMVYAR